MIRDARRSDLPFLRAIQQSLREPAPELLDTAVGDGSSDRDDVTVGDVLVSVRAGQPVGYVLSVPGEEGWIAEIAVAPDARREGRGRRLLDAACERLREQGCSTVSLAVSPNDGAAIALYRSAGFVQSGRDPDSFECGPALLFRRSLSTPDD